MASENTFAVVTVGREVRRVREEALAKIDGGLRAVYRTLELPGKNPRKDARAALDAAVLAAYGFSPQQDLLAQLLALNLSIAPKIEAGQSVTAPGIPPGYPEPAQLVTEDCVRPGTIPKPELKPAASQVAKPPRKPGKGGFWNT